MCIRDSCIVTAVFLGLAVQSGKGLQISVDPTEAKDKLPALEKTMAKVNTALKSLNPKHTDVKSVKAPDHKPGKYITGGLKTVINTDTFLDLSLIHISSKRLTLSTAACAKRARSTAASR